MWMTIIGFLGGPVIQGLISAYQAHLTAVNTSEATAADLAGKEIAAQTAEEQAITQYRIAELGYWYEPDKLMGYTVAFLFAKVVVWDICLGFGTTDLHQGFVTTTSGLIISFYFGKRGFENIAKILQPGKRR
jgi:hypothetical protein